MALEQNEIKKVITVDLGSATTSLKEYKKHIDELRGSLLQLDSSSEEYQKIAAEIQSEQDKLNEVMRAGNTTLSDAKKHIDELRGSLLHLDETSEEYQAIAAEIKVEQEKLNEVMSVGKNVTEAADGSYDKLVQTMAELKKQWRATGDEAERNELGTKILDINNQLKELDASTGNFQRNVGDYANAFEEAFKRCLDGITRIDGPLGEIGGTVKSMIPLIKAINTTALSGLSGIKKAIASTGIGLLVVALGMIVAYWEDIAKYVRETTGWIDEQAEAVEALAQQQEKRLKQYETEKMLLENRLELLKSLGRDEIEVLEEEAAERRRIANEEAKEDRRLLEIYHNSIGNVQKDITEQRRQNSEEQTKIYEEANKAQIDAENELAAAMIKRITEQKDAVSDASDDVKAKAETIFSEIEALADKPGQMMHVSLGRIRELYSEIQGIMAEVETEKAETEEANKAAEQRAADAKRRAEQRKAQLEAERKEAQAIAENARKASMSELQLLDEQYAEELAKLEKFGLDTTVLTENYEKERTRIVQEEEDNRKQAEQEKIEAIQAAEDERFRNIKERYDAEAEQLKFEAEMDIENERALADAKFEIEQDLLERKIALQEQYLEEYQGTQEGLIEAEAELDALRQQYANNKRKYDKESADYAKKQVEEEKQAKTAALNATLGMTKSILGSIADLYEEGSQEQKNLQIAETTINTLAGAIGAFLQGMSSYPAPYGAIIGAASAATATAAGIAQIAKIKSTSMGSSSVASPQVSAPSMTSVSPLLDETTDLNRMTTLSEQGDSARNAQNTRVYVVEQDIRDAGHKAEVVEDNATF